MIPPYTTKIYHNDPGIDAWNSGIDQFIRPLDYIIRICISGIVPASLSNSVTRTNFRIHEEEL